MTLIDLTHFPPGGYAYNCPEIKLNIPPGSELATMGLDAVVTAVQTARVNNPWSGLDPSRPACFQAVCEYQCARFKNKPDLLKTYCGEPSQVPDSARAITGCGGCGQ